jgi:guanylate kinase
MVSGRLFVISAPSGAGKTTLCRKLVGMMPGLKESVSYTTRSPRPGEADGADYRFVSVSEFNSMAERGEFVEWAEVHGNRYGTSEKSLRQMMEAGTDVLLDIDTQGARQLRAKFPEAVLVFVLPPSFDELRRRLAERMSDSEEVIRRRLRNAVGEIGEYKFYDYVIVNDVLDEALLRLKCIVLAKGLETARVDAGWVEREFMVQEVQG